METVKLNNELVFSYPEGFVKMDKEELSKGLGYNEENGFGIKDVQRHLIISIGWKRSAFASFMLSETEAAKKAEENISRMMKTYGYKLENLYEKSAGDEKCAGFRYTYKAQETEMTGESWCVKYNKTFYYFNFYMRTELFDESQEVLNEILDQIRWE